MKCNAKVAAFLVFLAILFIASIAWAAAEASKSGGDPSVVLALIGNAFASLGSAFYLAKQYAGKVDNHEKILPEVLAALKAIEEGMHKLGASVRELYDSRNEHSENLVEINTLHQILGCKDRLKELAAELKRGSHAG